MTKYLSSLLLISLLFAACRKNKDDGDNGDGNETAAQKATTILSVQAGAAKVYADAWASKADTAEALGAMCDWIIAQPDVSKAYLMGLNVVRIEYKNGLASSINLIRTDAAGKRVTRGGGSPSGDEGYKRTYILGGQSKTSSELQIPSTKVLIFAPHFNEFYGAGNEYPFLSKFDEAPTTLEVTVVTEKSATLAELRKAGDYGLVVLNTHGLPGGFLMYAGSDELDGLKPPGHGPSMAEMGAALIDAENIPDAELLSGNIELQTGVLVPEASKAAETRVFHGALLTYKYLRTMPSLDETVVFGNHCYSGWTVQGSLTNNLSDAWLDRGAVSYYGYAFGDGSSDVVPNEFCVRMEDSLISNMMRADSTGIAHLAADVAVQSYATDRRATAYPIDLKPGTAYRYFREARVADNMLFRHFHDPRYSYGCGTFTDPRDGQKYKLACIGDQVWMAENLRYNAPGSRFYEDNPANGALYGKLYPFSVMMGGAAIVAPTVPGPRGICPQGWHLPSRYDFDKMRATLIAANGASALATQLKAKNNAWLNDPTLTSPLRDKSGLAVMPAGYFDGPVTSVNEFRGKGEMSVFYLASAYASTTAGDVGLLILDHNSADIDMDEGDPSDEDLLPCRCLKDD